MIRRDAREGGPLTLRSADGAGRCDPTPADSRDKVVAMQSLFWLINTVINLFVFVIIASAILSWLVAFNVINMRNRMVAMIVETLYRLTEPALRPIRRFLPSFGGIDVSPVILILLLLFVQSLMSEYWPR